MNAKKYASVTSAIFGLVFLFHATRVINSWGAQFGPWSIPLWFSVLAALLAGYLAWSGWKLK